MPTQVSAIGPPSTRTLNWKCEATMELNNSTAAALDRPLRKHLAMASRNGWRFRLRTSPIMLKYDPKFRKNCLSGGDVSGWGRER